MEKISVDKVDKVEKAERMVAYHKKLQNAAANKDTHEDQDKKYS